MSSKELRRVEVLGRVESGDLEVAEAAELLRVSYRQAKRLWKRYREEGAEGLKHRSAGRASNRGKPKRFRQKVLRLVAAKYSGAEDKRFGPTLAAEHLASEDGLEVDAETLRRWMLGEGLWSRQRKRKAHRKRRERKEHFGELVQLDGSFHDWLEERGPRGCLMDMIDDATGTTLCRMGSQETTWAAANALRGWIERYGVPLALYTDWKNVYVREPTEKELLRGEVAQTQFGRMCERLGIKIIAASSPQAKGRVERGNGTHQDRLIKKMRRKKIASFEGANEYLEEEYLPEHNRRFAVAPASLADFHRKRPTRTELREIFRLEAERTISNDWVVRYENRYFQVQRQSRSYAPARSKVVVCEWEDGRVELRYRGQKLAWEEFAGAPPKAVPPRAERVQPPKVASGEASRPAGAHPWRQGYEQMKARPKPRPAADRMLQAPVCASP